VVGAPPTKNNSVDLRGPAIGGVPFVAATSRRMVPVKVGMMLPGLSVGPAYLTLVPGSAQSSTTAQLTIPVVNQGTDYPCFVAAENLYYLGATGATLNPKGDPIFVNGSVGDVGAGTFYTNSCLAPGETGYVLSGPPAAYFSGTSSIELDLTALTSGQAPAGHLTPKLYELGTCGTTRSLRVTAVNDGLSTVTVAMEGLALGPGILLDDAGLPAGWLYLEDRQTVQLAPGGSPVYFLSTDLSTAAAVTRVQFFLNFDPPM
jgi:hypothetical protein